MHVLRFQHTGCDNDAPPPNKKTKKQNKQKQKQPNKTE